MHVNYCNGLQAARVHRVVIRAATVCNLQPATSHPEHHTITEW